MLSCAELNRTELNWAERREDSITCIIRNDFLSLKTRIFWHRVSIKSLWMVSHSQWKSIVFSFDWHENEAEATQRPTDMYLENLHLLVLAHLCANIHMSSSSSSSSSTSNRNNNEWHQNRNDFSTPCLRTS